MGWLSDLFGRQKGGALSVTPTSPTETAPFEDRFFTLDKPYWFGPCSRSPNGRWLVSWRDADPSGHRGGARTKGEGAYLLYDALTSQVVIQGRLERPNNGHVADNGAFVLEDWHFSSDLIGTLCAFDAHGQSLLRRTFSANLLTNAISHNGSFVVCHTAASPSEDGSSLFLFELATGKQMFAVPPSAGWAMSYTIDEQRVEVIAHIKKLGDFRYGSSGEFLESIALEEARLKKGDYSTVILTAEVIVKRGDAALNRLKEVLCAVQRARRDGADDDRGWKAAALKVEGLVREASGESGQALVLYQQALDINPKIGLKRKVAALQKALR